MNSAAECEWELCDGMRAHNDFFERVVHSVPNDSRAWETETETEKVWGTMTQHFTEALFTVIISEEKATSDVC